MTDQISITVTRGTPTTQEEHAVRAAIEAIWREEQRRAAASRRPDPWVLAARAEATRTGSTIASGTPDAWRLGNRLAIPHPAPAQPGRGDAR